MITVGGDSLIDFIQQSTEAGLPVYKGFPGGSAYNVACALGKQGANAGWLGPFSDDSLGQLLQSHLERSGSQPLMAAVTDPTTLAVVSTVEGQPSYQFYREGTADRQVSSDSLAAALPMTVSCFHVGSLALTGGEDSETWTALFEAQYAAGTPTSLDPNIRAAFVKDRPSYMARFERQIAAATLIKLSDEDCEWLFPGEPVAEAAAKLFDRSSAALVVLTLGAEGAIAFSAQGREQIPVASVSKLADTVGAGDTFMASLLVKLTELGRLSDTLAEISPSEINLALRYAATAAAINCERVGCQPPTQAEIVARLMS